MRIEGVNKCSVTSWSQNWSLGLFKSLRFCAQLHSNISCMPCHDWGLIGLYATDTKLSGRQPRGINSKLWFNDEQTVRISSLTVLKWAFHQSIEAINPLDLVIEYIKSLPSAIPCFNECDLMLGADLDDSFRAVYQNLSWMLDARVNFSCACWGDVSSIDG